MRGAPLQTREAAEAAHDGLEDGNLYKDHSDEFPDWPGCQHQDCLPACDTTRGHCERLKLFIDLQTLRRHGRGR